MDTNILTYVQNGEAHTVAVLRADGTPWPRSEWPVIPAPVPIPASLDDLASSPTWAAFRLREAGAVFVSVETDDVLD
jgi:hypothetical protein